VRLLLDSHVLLWALVGSSRIQAETYAVMGDRDNQVYVSAATVWELAIKLALGKLPARTDIGAWLPEQMERIGMVALPVTFEHAAAVEHLPMHHRDPFDRLLVAQAQADGLTIVTADVQLERYDVPLIRC
jgi:PIN domain nuclease of toxin-antitoxin system